VPVTLFSAFTDGDLSFVALRLLAEHSTVT